MHVCARVCTHSEAREPCFLGQDVSLSLDLAVSEAPGFASSNAGVTGAHYCARVLHGSLGSEF